MDNFQAATMRGGKSNQFEMGDPFSCSIPYDHFTAWYDNGDSPTVDKVIMFGEWPDEAEVVYRRHIFGGNPPECCPKASEWIPEHWEKALVKTEERDPYWYWVGEGYSPPSLWLYYEFSDLLVIISLITTQPEYVEEDGSTIWPKKAEYIKMQQFASKKHCVSE
jgi:hypothetical protein